jgi:hypothetical protein
VFPNNIVLLVTIKKFEASPMLVNVNKLKPNRHMKYEVKKQEQHMLIYWEQNASGVQANNSNTDEEDEDYKNTKTTTVEY